MPHQRTSNTAATRAPTTNFIPFIHPWHCAVCASSPQYNVCIRMHIWFLLSLRCVHVYGHGVQRAALAHSWHCSCIRQKHTHTQTNIHTYGSCALFVWRIAFIATAVRDNHTHAQSQNTQRRAPICSGIRNGEEKKNIRYILTLYIPTATATEVTASEIHHRTNLLTK